MAVDPKEKFQRTGINYNFEDNYDPSFVDDFYVSNIIRRTLSHLYAYDEETNKPVRLRATSSGLLLVSAIPPIRDTYEVYKKLIPAGNEDVITFNEPVYLVEIWTYEGALQIKKSTDGSVYGGIIEIPKGSYWRFESTTKSLWVYNPDASNDNLIQVVGWR